MFQTCRPNSFGDIPLTKVSLLRFYFFIFLFWINFMVTTFGWLLWKFIKFKFRKVCICFFSISKWWLQYLLTYKAHKNRTVGLIRVDSGRVELPEHVTICIQKISLSFHLLVNTHLKGYYFTQVNKACYSP